MLPRLRFRRAFLIAATFFTIAFVFLPYDSALRLSVSVNVRKVQHQLYNPSLLAVSTKPGPLGGNPVREVTLIIKTGYATRHRIQPLLDALNSTYPVETVLLAGDWSQNDEGYRSKEGGGSREIGRYYYRNKEMPVSDVVGWLLEDGLTRFMREGPRLAKYNELRDAIRSGKSEIAETIARVVGKELDAIKFLPALRNAHRLRQNPFLLVIDDDFLPLPSTISRLISYLPRDKPLYLGHPSGDFLTRYASAQGGMLFTRKAIDLLVDDRDNFRRAFADSESERKGDRLIGRALLPKGVFLDERYGAIFNGRAPGETRIYPGMGCVPLFGIHGLDGPDAMETMNEVINSISKTPEEPLRYTDLFSTQISPLLPSSSQEIITDRDFVGDVSEEDKDANRGWSFEFVLEPAKCRQLCEERSRCLAWTVDVDSNECKLGGWLVSGVRRDGRWSGVMRERVEGMVGDGKECGR